MEGLKQDLRFAVRMLLMKKSFTAVAIFTLALGIGATTAIFSIINAILLRDLPFNEPDKLVLLWQHQTQQTPSQLPFAYLNFDDIRERNQSFENVAAWNSYIETQFNLTGDGEPTRVQYALVSADFFSVLGAQPHEVMRLFIKRGMWLAFMGIGIGLAAAFALTRLMKNLLFEVSATDSLTFILVPILLIGAALVACFVPARRAAKTDPMVALRYE